MGEVLSDERVATLESEVRHINKDVSVIKDDISDIKEANSSIKESLAILAHIAENNQKLGPRVEELEKSTLDIKKLSPRIEALEKWRWLIVGGMTGLAFLVVNLEKIKNLFS